MRVQPLNTDFLQNIMGLGKPKRAQGVPIQPLPTQQPQPQGKLGELERNRPGSGVQEAAASGDIGAILDRLAPEQSAATHRHAGNATWSALGDAMGQMGSFLATSQGAPYQSPSMRHKDHLSMYEQKLAEYEQQSRAHELMVAQQEISEIIGNQEREFKQQQAIQQAQIKAHESEQAHRRNIERDQTKSGLTKEEIELRNQGTLQATEKRTEGQLKIERERTARQQSQAKETGKSGEKFLYDREGNRVTEVQREHIEPVVALLLSEIGQKHDPGPDDSHPDLTKRTNHLLGKTSLTDAEKWELVLDNWEKSSSVRKFLGLGEIPQRKPVINNPETFQRQFFQDAGTKQAAQRLIKNEGISEQEALELLKYATPQQINDLLR